MDKDMTRSQFIKRAGIAATGIAAAGILGSAQAFASEKTSASGSASTSASSAASGGASASASPAASLADAKYDVDIVIVGGGAAGMSALAEAVDEGADAMLIESNAAVGGTTQFAEGILGVNTALQQSLGVQNNIPDMVKAELDFSNYAADPRLIKDYLLEADNDIQWLMDMGVPFIDGAIGGTTQHLYDGKGAAMIAKLLEHVQAANATVLTSTRGKHLVIDGGSVAGLIAEGEDGEFAIKTKAVVLCCSGYIQNEDMMAEMLRFSPSRVKVTAAANHLGDSIVMSKEAGGEQSGITLLHFIWAGLQNFDLHSELSTAACNEPYFWVDEKGARFTDESVIFAPSLVANTVLNQKHAYSILSKAEVDRLATEGCTVGWGSYIFAGSQMTKLQSELDDAVANPVEGFFYGETLSDLATTMDIEPDALAKTVSDYNAMCEAGEDTDFGKAADYLRAIPDDGPFYGFELMCNAFCTMGGIRVDEKNEVVDDNFDAIPGLYCAGVDCSGLQGTTYCIKLGGGAQAYAVYSGRNSIRNAAVYVQA